jgi:glycosyltransferase involved in cell wall biosynthesis
MSDRPLIICFAGDVWDGNPHSRHHLMRRLVPEFDVLFVEGVPMRGTIMERHELRRIGAKLKRVRQLRTVMPGLHVLRPLPVPPSGEVGRRLQLAVVHAEVIAAIRRRSLSGPRLVWFSQPLLGPLLGRLGERGSILYYQDRYDAFTHVDGGLLRRHLAMLARRCDVSVATAGALASDLKALGVTATLLPHGVDIGRFAQPRAAPADLAGLEQPLIGFVGLIDTYLDLQAIRATADRLTRGTVVLVGGTNIDPRPLAHPRIAMLGQRPYEDVPAYMQAFAVCILPFLDNRLNHGVNPIKLREYLAAGRPTVASDLPEMRPYASVLELAEGAERFPDRVISALDPSNDTEVARARRRAAVQGDSWDDVVDRLRPVLRSLLQSHGPGQAQGTNQRCAES